MNSWPTACVNGKCSACKWNFSHAFIFTIHSQNMCFFLFVRNRGRWMLIEVYGWVFSRWGIPVGSCRRWWERSNANRPQEGWWWLRLGPAWWIRMSASGWWVGFLMILMLYFDVLWFNLMFYIFMMFYVFRSYQILDICLVFWCF